MIFRQNYLAVLKPFFYMAMVVAIYCICYELPQLWIVTNFNTKSDALRYESLTILGFTASLLCISFILNKKYFYVLSALAFTVIPLITISSWLYYDFYKDFLIAETIILFPDLINGGATGGLHLLNSYNISLDILYAYILFTISLIKKKI